MATKTRLNMEHGFMQSIIRNQLDRDNYDKEMKAKASKKVIPSSLAANKVKKPDIHTYAPPVARSQESVPQKNVSDIYLFTFEYEDKDGKLFHITVNKDDNAASLARQFGQDRNFETPMIDALCDFLQEQIDKYTVKKHS